MIVWPIPCYCVLVQHPVLGNVLFDTGIDDGYESRWPKNLLEEYPVKQFHRVEDRLGELGLCPNDIDMLILSHMHFDHAGNLRLFCGTKAGKHVVIQEEEARHGFTLSNIYDCQEIRYRHDGYVRHEFNGLDGAVKFAKAYPDTPLILWHWGSVDAPDWNEFNGNPDVLCSRIVNPGRVVVLAPGEKYRI